jgi:hypothetical protein
VNAHAQRNEQLAVARGIVVGVMQLRQLRVDAAVDAHDQREARHTAGLGVTRGARGARGSVTRFAALRRLANGAHQLRLDVRAGGSRPTTGGNGDEPGYQEGAGSRAPRDAALDSTNPELSIGGP